MTEPQANPRPVRYRVLHETCYDYPQPVTSSRQLAHLSPRTTPWQAVHSHAIHIDPEPGERTEALDFFGNPIVAFAVDIPHPALTVRAKSVVEVIPWAPAPGTPSPPWEQACEPACRLSPSEDLDRAQFRVGSPMAPILAVAREYAAASFAAERPWLAAVLELTRRIRADFTYDPEATTVTTPVAEVIELRRGVCQDFAHLMLSCLRSLGLPARYVSGYILNTPPPGKEKLEGADASHAWVAAHCPGLGWVGFDPTNAKLADTEFVTVAWGRDFADVTPLRGVVLGSGEQEPTVQVSVRPV